MGLFEKLFPKEAVSEVTAGYLKTLTSYMPIFTSFRSGIYESELCRAAIHATATHCSKLKPVVLGARQDLQKILEFQPNKYMNTQQFLYKVATILETENTAFIIPIYDKYYEKIVGFYPVQPTKAEIREKNGKDYVAFQFATGQHGAMDFDKVGIMTKFFYNRDFYGEDNGVLRETLNLIAVQNQGIEEGIKQGATIRFMGKLASTLKSKDIEEERQRWVADNLNMSNQSGLALVDAKYSDFKQIDSKPYVIDEGQMKAVQNNVYRYFGVNEKILTNSFTPEEWAAFYEAKVEPFALQLSLCLSNMIYTNEQKVRGNEITFSSNRLQYASTAEKLAVVQQMSDRGMMSRNEGREVFNLPPIENGDNYIIRGEYYNADEKVSEGSENNG